MTNMNNTFDRFFGDVMKRSEEVMKQQKQTKETKKETKTTTTTNNQNINYSKVFNDFFGSVMNK